MREKVSFPFQGFETCEGSLLTFALQLQPPLSPKISISMKDFHPPSSTPSHLTKPKPSPSPALATSTVGSGVPRIKTTPLWRRTEVLSLSSGIGRGSVELDEDYSKPSSTKSSRFSESSENSNRTLPSILPSSFVAPERRANARVTMDSAPHTQKDEVKETTPDQALPLHLPVVSFLPLCKAESED